MLITVTQSTDQYGDVFVNCYMLLINIDDWYIELRNVCYFDTLITAFGGP